MKSLTLATVLVATAILGSCTHSPMKATRRHQARALAEQQRNAITHPGELSAHSRLVYRLLDLDMEARRDPERALQRLDEERTESNPLWTKTISPLQRGLAITETSYLLADRTPDREEARRLFKRSIVKADATLRGHVALESLLDPRYRLLVELYNRGLARLAVEYREIKKRPTDWPGVGDSDPVTVVPGPGVDDLTLFDQLIPVDELELDGIPNRHARYGLGAAFIAVRKNPDPDRKNTVAEPLTMIAQPGDGGGLKFTFLDPSQTHHLPQGNNGDGLPIAADFTAPLAWLSTGRNSGFNEKGERFSHESMVPMIGVYPTGPYDPLKIPVIIIHGLWSTPLDLMPLANEIRGDPTLRDRYQVYFYAYETESSILENAATFREKLGEWLEGVDPDTKPASRNVVLIGHSMGGLLAKFMVKDVGARLWPAPSDRHGDKYACEPLPDVKRVIFMATPHLGSERAGGFNSLVGKLVIRQPDEKFEVHIKAKNPDIELLNDMLKDGPRGLRTDAPLLKELDGATWKEDLPFHSIIADVDEAGRTDGGDGVVKYMSSHVEEATSERVVHADHGGVRTDPAAMAEVRRILHEHLAQPKK